MLTKDKQPLIAIAESGNKSGHKNLAIRPEMINRHGLITGATGTGKTVSLQTMAETFSALGVPVFMADVKGDLSGVSRAGKEDGKPWQRVQELNLAAHGYTLQPFPTCFWDVYGRKGHPFRATISEVGPLLLSRLLDLNDVQSGLMQMIFRIADDNGLLLLDLKDLRSMTVHVGEERSQYVTRYGQISTASIGAIQRALLRLESEGADYFFGEPALDVADLMRQEQGKGMINILDATALVNAPALYSCVLLWLLSELFETLPEAGDQPLPRLALFFDEAHLLFNGISPALLQKVEQVARLVRSRGVGIYFISQNPSDMPDSVLGQLGNRIQHALRAFTPRDQKAVRAAAEAFRPNPQFATTEAIANLGVGEALVSFLDANGAPQIVEKALIIPPQSRIGPISDQERRESMALSAMGDKYDRVIDRESAYEILAARARWMQQAQALQERSAAEAKRLEREEKRQARAAATADPLGGLLGNVMRQATRNAGNTIVREVSKSVFGNGLGGKITTSIARGILGSLLGGRR